MQTEDLTNHALSGLLIVTFVLAFLPVFQKLGIHWAAGDNSYCYLIVPLFIYLCWEKRDVFRFSEFSWNPWGMVPIGFSILVMFIGELGSVVTLLYVGIWGCIVSLMAIIYGLRLKHLLFPLLILAFIVPMPPFVNQILTFNLKLAASTLSVMILRLFGVSVFLEGNIIDLGFTQMQVVDACSGLRYFVPLILIALLLGYFYCSQVWQKLILLVIVPPLSILVNALRIFGTAMLHVWGYAELADDLLHDFAGLVIFILAGAILFGCCMILRRLGAPSEAMTSTDDGGRHVRPMVPVTVSAVLCLIFVGSGFALQKLPSAANLPDRKSFDAFPMRIGKWNARRYLLSQEIIDSLWADDYVSATYFRDDLPNAIYLLIPFYSYQGTRHTAHAPQSCMLGGGWSLTGTREHLAKNADDSELEFRSNIWEKGATRILGGYFFFQRGRVITSPWMNKYWLMVDAFTMHRTDGALVRAEMTIAPGQSMDEAARILESFMGKVYAILPEYVPK